jgi:hypothetical protein
VNTLPKHDVMSPLVRSIEGASIVAAWSLVFVHVIRLWHVAVWLWPVAIVFGMVAADLFSGIVHWSADTWGAEASPVIGRRFLRPFRVHHINPDDFLRRDVIDCNGDVAMFNLVFLLAAFALPDAGAVFLLAFSVASLPTNQVHQWAHMPRPPKIVDWLQRAGVVLSRREHARHHAGSHTANYCIANGWCNGALTAIGFFPRLESAITALTGAQPRHDSK